VGVVDVQESSGVEQPLEIHRIADVSQHSKHGYSIEPLELEMLALGGLIAVQSLEFDITNASPIVLCIVSLLVIISGVLNGKRERKREKGDTMKCRTSLTSLSA
jgi:hypothetical protein